jgi:hypothetical protein
VTVIMMILSSVVSDVEKEEGDRTGGRDDMPVVAAKPSRRRRIPHSWAGLQTNEIPLASHIDTSLLRPAIFNVPVRAAVLQNRQDDSHLCLEANLKNLSFSSLATTVQSTALAYPKRQRLDPSAR